MWTGWESRHKGGGLSRIRQGRAVTVIVEAWGGVGILSLLYGVGFAGGPILFYLSTLLICWPGDSRNEFSVICDIIVA